VAEGRSWGLFVGGLASGLGLAGLYHWKYRRGRPLGRIYKIGDRFYADSAVVEELVRRVPGSQNHGRYGGEIYLYRRGRLTFKSEPGSGRSLPGQVGPDIFHMFARDTDVEDVAIELIRFGLARSGGAFVTWPVEGPRGTWTPPPEPLHPSAFDPSRQAWVAVAPLRDPPPRPIGHYFEVGYNFYADENCLQTLEGFHGADFHKRVVVPFWRRGHLELFEQTRAKMLPEQVGPLFRVESHLSGVSLADLMIELEGLGLVSWGGAWPQFPARLAGVVATGPLTTSSAGRVVTDSGRQFIDETALKKMLSRLPNRDGRVTWRGRVFVFPQAPRQDGGLHVVTPEGGRPEDELARAFVEDLILHKIAARAERRPQPGARPVDVLAAAAERLVETLPRPELAPLRTRTRTPAVAPGSLIVMPLDPAEAVVFDPEDRFALALHLPSGQGFMFTFGELADPDPDDLRDPARLWDWRGEDAPDTEAIVLAQGLDWGGVAAVLGFEPRALDPDSESPDSQS
jgi:hypothetical protein